MKYLNTYLFFFISMTLSAQITTGSIRYTINMGGAGDNSQAASLLQDMEMELSFKPNVSVVDMTMMGMIETKTINEGSTTTQYMDMMGQKIKVVTDQSELEEILGASGDELVEKMNQLYKYNKVPGDTQEILGFQCTRVDITVDLETLMGESDEDLSSLGLIDNMTITAYVTEDIDIGTVNFMMTNNLMFKGAPLLMTMDMGIMKMDWEATSFSKDVHPSVFQAPKGDYKEMDPADIPGMGGFRF